MILLERPYSLLLYLILISEKFTQAYKLNYGAARRIEFILLGCRKMKKDGK